MPTPSPSSTFDLSTISFPLLSVIVGGVLALLLFADYFRRKRAESHHSPDPTTAQATPLLKAQAPPPRKLHPRSHSHNVDKDQNKKHHPLDVNTLKGHGDSVTSLCFSSDGRNLATTCADGVVRVFRIDDVSSKSFKLLKINLPAGAHPTAIAFSDGASSVIVAAQVLSGSSLFMYGDVTTKPSGEGKQGKLPSPEIKWEHQKVHDHRSVLTMTAVSSTYGHGNGSTIVASCSEGASSVKLPNLTQLRKFCFEFKVWEIIYSKDASVKEVLKVMQLKGHKSAVTSLCFTPNSEQIITASKDGSLRIWNINVRYHLDEDPKTLKVFPIPLKDSKGLTLHYDRISLSPDGKILVTTSGSTLQWLCAETGKILDTAEKAHEGDITGIAWSPHCIPMAGTQAMVLATSGEDKRVRLWLAPEFHSS
ncbi:uncharacterized protein A4U43_C04F11370 [Asparagus officinalis]|uniref:Anaphase-promoting complex subunit 4 WD40 domain-containing protein n=1 Tax=Asparagus officinalis TaxID=4686 RepID=A0A5P1F1V3_ASPOF|nr:uncharacterized protein A4U43_C04F11370 [Asparagus officinalis]